MKTKCNAENIITLIAISPVSSHFLPKIDDTCWLTLTLHTVKGYGISQLNIQSMTTPC